MSTQLARARARAIVSECFDGYSIPSPLPTDPSSEQIKIKPVLTGIDVTEREAIYRCIRGRIETDHCLTQLGANRFRDADFDTVGDVVDEMIATTNCP